MKSPVAALFILTAGCAIETPPEPAAATDPSDSTDPAPARAPRLNLLLTDAPGDFESVWVKISSVEIESEAGWLALTSEPQRFDLLTLQNNVTAALGSSELEAGAYGQIRMIVDSASVVVDGVESQLTIPSAMKTGIKIDLDATIEDGMEYSMTLDYDAAKSVKWTGAGYLMTPVISVKEFVGSPAEPTDSTDPTDPT